MPPKLVLRRRPARGHPPARLREARTISRRTPGCAASRSSRATSAARRTPCSASRSRRCCASGRSAIRGGSETIFRSLQNVRRSHLLDRKLFDFADVAAAGVADPDGDKAFDPEDEIDKSVSAFPLKVVKALTRSASSQGCQNNFVMARFRCHELRRTSRRNLRQPGRGRAPLATRPRRREQLGQVRLCAGALGDGSRERSPPAGSRRSKCSTRQRRQAAPSQVPPGRRILLRPHHPRGTT